MTVNNHRLTFDLDFWIPQFELKAIRIWETLKREADRVNVDISSSGYGLHFIAFFEEQPDEHVFRHRLMDHDTRIKFDRERGQYGLLTNVLWDTKPEREGTKDRDYSDVYDALDAIHAQTSDIDRLKYNLKNGLVI